MSQNYTLEVSSIDQYLKYIHKESIDSGLLLFRGQDTRYSLDINNTSTESVYPSVYREWTNFKTKNYIDYEADIFFNYLKDYAKGCSFDDPLSVQDVLVEMAHKGKPTRLLDVTTNSLIALFNACNNTNDMDGVVYIFKETQNFLHEHPEIKRFDLDSGQPTSLSYLYSTIVCKIKNFYLNLIRCSTSSDIITMLIHAFFDGNTLNLYSPTPVFEIINRLLIVSKRFLTTCKIEQVSIISRIFNFLNAIQDQMPQDIIGYIDTLNVHLMELNRKLVITQQDDKKYYYNPILFHLMAMVGNPVLISPSFHKHESIISNRILTQRSKFLLFPTKIALSTSKLCIDELFGMQCNNYANTLVSITVKSSIKGDLRTQIKSIYSDSEFYPDALNNIY